MLMLFIMQIFANFSEFLAEAAYLSVDPYMRAYAPFLKTGKTHIGEQVAR